MKDIKINDLLKFLYLREFSTVVEFKLTREALFLLVASRKYDYCNFRLIQSLEELEAFWDEVSGLVTKIYENACENPVIISQYKMHKYEDGDGFDSPRIATDYLLIHGDPTWNNRLEFWGVRPEDFRDDYETFYNHDALEHIFNI